MAQSSSRTESQYYENGRIREEKIYQNDELRHVKSWHYTNGNGLERLSEQWSYKDGKLEGEKTIWGIDGRLQARAFYRNGKLEGEYKIWFLEQLGFLDCYQDGKLNGKSTSWHIDGQPRSTGFYRAGEREGEYKFLRQNGSIDHCVYYRRGRTVDRFFSLRKKIAILRVKKRILMKFLIPVISSYIISDLLKLW